MSEDDKGINLRIATFTALKQITGRDGAKRFLLAKLLGKKTWAEARNFTDVEVQICNALIGPNGHTYYRMLLVQRGFEDRQDDYKPEVYYRESWNSLRDADNAEL